MQTMTFSELKSAYAAHVRKDEQTAAKQLRSRLRSNFATLATIDPTNYGSKGKIKEQANDKRPWGPIPAAFVRDVLKIDTPKATTRKRTTRKPNAKAKVS